MRNPITTIVLIIGTILYPPIGLLFIPVVIGHIMHYMRLRRTYRRR